MKNFDWTSFTKRIAIRSSLAEIYEAWTTSVNLEKWFLERVIFRDEEEKLLESNKLIECGVLYDWYWFLDSVPMQGEILNANGKDFIQFSFEGPSLVDVRLKEFQDYVIVELYHHSIPQDDFSKEHIRLGCSNGWAFYLCNLKSVYEGGIDLRNKDENLGVMINN